MTHVSTFWHFLVLFVSLPVVCKLKQESQKDVWETRQNESISKLKPMELDSIGLKTCNNGNDALSLRSFFAYNKMIKSQTLKKHKSVTT